MISKIFSKYLTFILLPPPPPPRPPGVEIPISVWSIVCITGVSGVTIFYWLDKSSRWLISGQAGGLVEGDTFIHCWMFTFTSPTSNTRRKKISKQKPSLHQTVLHSTCFWSLIKRWTGADLVLFRSVPADDEKILLKITDWRLLMNLWAFV